MVNLLVQADQQVGSVSLTTTSFYYRRGYCTYKYEPCCASTMLRHSLAVNGCIGRIAS